MIRETIIARVTYMDGVTRPFLLGLLSDPGTAHAVDIEIDAMLDDGVLVAREGKLYVCADL